MAKPRTDRTALGTVDGKDYSWAIYYDENNVVVNQRLEWRIPDLREAIRSEPGCKILSADYSQIEIKLMAFLSGDPWLKEAINSGKDIHCYLCTDAFGAEMDFDYDLIYAAYKDKSHPRNLELTTLRADFKVVVFGVPYGAGPPRVAFMTGKTVEEATELISKFFSRAKVLKIWLDAQGNSAIRYGFTASPRGRKRFYVRPAADDPKAHETLAQIQRWAGNHPIQAGNVDMLKPAMKMIYDELMALGLTWEEARILFVVHDEIVMQCKDDLVGVIQPIMERSMTKSYDLIIPDIINEITVAVGDYWEKA
jgi:DNA polymerase-1